MPSSAKRLLLERRRLVWVPDSLLSPSVTHFGHRILRFYSSALSVALAKPSTVPRVSGYQSNTTTICRTIIEAKK